MAQLPEHPFYDIPGPVAIAHRGGDAAGEGIENTFLAFESALKSGLQYAETDVIASVDGVVVVMHGAKDAREQARTGLPIRSQLQEMTFQEIQAQVRIGGEQVPSLEALLVDLPDMRLFIDPKTNEAVRPLARVINKLGVYGRVSIGSFSYERTRAVLAMLDTKQQVASTIAVAGSLALVAASVHVPWSRGYIKTAAATQFAMPYERVTAAMTAIAHELGMRMIVWTPNCDVDIEASFRKGVDGVMSDRTLTVKAIAEAFANL